jgi:hypothetical protein
VEDGDGVDFLAGDAEEVHGRWEGVRGVVWNVEEAAAVCACVRLWRSWMEEVGYLRGMRLSQCCFVSLIDAMVLWSDAYLSSL